MMSNSFQNAPVSSYVSPQSTVELGRNRISEASEQPKEPSMSRQYETNVTVSAAWPYVMLAAMAGSWAVLIGIGWAVWEVVS